MHSSNFTYFVRKRLAFTIEWKPTNEPTNGMNEKKKKGETKTEQFWWSDELLWSYHATLCYFHIFVEKHENGVWSMAWHMYLLTKHLVDTFYYYSIGGGSSGSGSSKSGRRAETAATTCLPFRSTV